MNCRKGIWLFVAAVAAVGLLLSGYALARLYLPPQREIPVGQMHQETDEGDLTVDNPVDWESLQEQNGDIYAWLEVPGTEIAYPVVQRFGDDTFYLRHNLQGEYSAAGEIFSEYRYNTKDFSDPVTLLYGHNMKNGSMFGTLQEYAQTLTLDDDAVFYVYLPDRRLTYQIFAALPHDDRHILHYHNFSQEKAYTAFFDEVFATKNLYANLAPEYRPDYGDQVVILTTCFQGDNTQRYLMMGVLKEEVPANGS